MTLAEIKPGDVLYGSYKKIGIIVIMRRRKSLKKSVPLIDGFFFLNSDLFCGHPDGSYILLKNYNLKLKLYSNFQITEPSQLSTKMHCGKFCPIPSCPTYMSMQIAYIKHIYTKAAGAI